MPPNLGSAAEQKDLGKLLDEVRDFAGQFIGAAGGCPPFGATVGADGKIGLVVHQPGPGKSAQEYINTLVTSVRQQAKAQNLRAACIAYPISAEVQKRKIDAILASVHHRSGQPLDVIVPFRREGKNIQFADPAIQPGTLSFF